MILRLWRRFDPLLATGTARTTVLKAISFALIGVINTAIHYAIFNLTYYGFLTRSAEAAAMMVRLTDRVAGVCHACEVNDVTVAAANIFAWVIAVSGSYAMNSFVTFAKESGRQLRFGDYARFVASGVAGLIAMTTVLVVVARLLPPWLAIVPAIAVSFLVNFSLSHFVVFRARREEVRNVP